MSASSLNERPLDPTEHLLRWALVLSLVGHIILGGAFLVGKHYGWWKINPLSKWYRPAQTLAQIKKAELAQQQLKQQQPELVFLDVDPSMVAEAPKNAKYYSSRNSQAANPDISIDSNTPKIDGTQTHVPKTQSAPRAKPVPLQPAPPKNSQPAEDAAEAKPKPKGGPAIGDLAMAKPAPQQGDGQAESDTGQAETRTRPRTLAEAKARQQIAPGEKMKQDGGIKRRLDVDPSFDAIATPFGEYDREVIEAIRSHWYRLLDSKEFSRDRTGRVVLEFNLNSDGRVTDLRVVESDVGELLTYVCKTAVTEPAPFGPWPSDMRRFLGTDVRDVRFAFYYE